MLDMSNKFIDCFNEIVGCFFSEKVNNSAPNSLSKESEQDESEFHDEDDGK